MKAFDILPSADRRENARMLADKLGAVVVLKGHDTVVAAPWRMPVIVAAGNALLATAGSGDVLTGTIGALAAQGLPVFEAALLGAYLHGIAGETAEKIIVADELPELISQAFIRTILARDTGGRSPWFQFYKMKEILETDGGDNV